MANNSTSLTTQTLLTLNNSLVGSFTDTNTENILLLQQLDTTGTGTTVVENALQIDSAGSSGITNAIQIAGTAGTIATGLLIADGAAGAITTGIAMTGTFTNLIDTPNFDVNNAGDITNVSAITADGALTISPTTTGTFLDFALETEWTFGTLINADFASGTTQGAGDIIGMQFDFDTSLTGAADRDLTGVNIIMNALTASDGAANTTTYTAYNISAAGALDTATTPTSLTGEE